MTAQATPSFSDAERDRRWRETRARMAVEDIQVLVMPAPAGPWDRLGANQRYLSQVGGSQSPVGMVFPTQGDPTIVVPSLSNWHPDGWVEDARDSDGGRFGRALADRLRELGLDGATVGVPYLLGNAMAAESLLPGGPIDALRTQLPDARLVDATALMDAQRSIKSDEEIAIMERASAVAEAGIFALGYHVQAGMLQTEALGILQGAILKAGGELGNWLRWECSPRPVGAGVQATPIPIQRGDIIQNELEAIVAGYSAGEIHPICVGKPPQAVYEMFDLSLKVFNEVLPRLQPGARVADIDHLVARAGEGTDFHISCVLLSAGLTSDGLEEAATLTERQALRFMPVVHDPDGMRISFGATVVVEAEGGRRLSKRPLELMLTSRSFLSAYGDARSEEPTAPWLA